MTTPYEIAGKRYDTPDEMEVAAQHLERTVAAFRKFSSEGSSQYELLRCARQLRDNAAAMRAKSTAEPS